MARFDRFIGSLARVKVSERACNPYTNAIRRQNLRLYLEEIGEPRILLVGEAPSHRGGRLTGIAFTSETIMLCGIDGRFLGENRGYQKASRGPKRSTEASATMVWATIKDIEPLPLLTPNTQRGQRTIARCHDRLARRRKRFGPAAGGRPSGR